MNYWVPKKRAHVFYRLIEGLYIQNYSAKVDVPKLELLKVKLGNDMKWWNEMKAWLFVLNIQFFLDSLEFQVNQENIVPTLSVLKVFLALRWNKKLFL